MDLTPKFNLHPTRSSVMLIICILFSMCFKSAAQDIVALTFSEKYTSNGSPIKLPMLSKPLRTSAKASSIVVDYDESDHNLGKVVEYVASIWKNSILNCDTIVVKIEKADIPEDINTEVYYRDIDGTYLPLSLITYLSEYDRASTYPDGIITINSNTVWDYCIGENISPNGKNLAYGIMRAFARIMGFGSSVTIDDSGNYRFSCKRGYSVFDELVANSSGTKLTSISVGGGKPNAALKSYANTSGQTYWINTSKENYQLQSPPYSGNNPPFVYIKDNGSLMRGDLSVGSHMLQVDKTTQTILNEIGWNTQSPSPAIRIVSDDVPESGLASAYESHTFRIEKGNVNIQNPQWVLMLPLINGKTSTKTIADKGLSCTISPITNERIYRTNMDGDIEGVLQFSGTVNGKAIDVLPFKIYLELKPLIEYAVIDQIVNSTQYATYDAYYTVKYTGAEKIKVSIEEEYSSILRSRYINEPVIATGIADNIPKRYYAWIDFTAENKYGKSVYTIELQPYGVVTPALEANQRETNRESSACIIEKDNRDVYEVYNINGLKIVRLDNLSDIDKILQNGIYVIQHFRNEELIGTHKQICR